MSAPALPAIAARVLRWQARHGRQGLPWQGTREPYRVWLSEVMLQQTQVATVLDYYPRFLARFPTLQSLASAPLDEVLALWAGLGYYSRARNLHRCARLLAEQERVGQLPTRAQQWQQLPGVGRSTANAIAAFCWGERVPILDGNVRRVLSRVMGFAQDLSQPAALAQLWQHAQDLCPKRQLKDTMPRYTQGLMDLGATVCTRSQPRCTACPLRVVCVAGQNGQPQQYPVKAKKAARTSEHWWLLLAQKSNGDIWLERRAERGIWAGLYCLPVFASEQTLRAALPPKIPASDTKALTKTSASVVLQTPAPVVHALTHKDLHLHLVVATLAHAPATNNHGAWFSQPQRAKLGLPAPVRKMLTRQNLGLA